MVLPASLVPAELRLQEEGTGLGSCSRAILLSKASMLPTEKEQLTFLSMPKNQDGSRKSALHLIEVSSGTAACPKGLHMLHASSAGEVDLVSEVKGLVASDLIYSISWQQEEQITSNCSTTLTNTLATGEFDEDTIPTIGFNYRRVRKGKITLNVWDLGGQERFRDSWEKYCRQADVIIFVVDSVDMATMDEARRNLHTLLDWPTL